MTQLKQIYFKQSEKLEYKFFDDKECTKEFEFNKDNKRLYMELKSGDITPAVALDNKCPYNRIDGFTLYICGYVPSFASQTLMLVFLNDKECNYSKYLPNDCAVLFFDKEENEWFYKATGNYGRLVDDDFTLELLRTNTKKIMLYTDELTFKNIREINKVAKMLKEKYGVEWVGAFTPFCFVKNFKQKIYTAGCVGEKDFYRELNWLENINKLITTNSTGFLEPQDTKHLKVINCKEIFEEYIKNYII